jgi:hypothetical protein
LENGKSDVFWVVTSCNSQGAQNFKAELPASAGFLLGFLFNREDGNNMFLRNVRLSPHYMMLQPRRLYIHSHSSEDLRSNTENGNSGTN